jgi:phospholipase/carboxylesterase
MALIAAEQDKRMTTGGLAGPSLDPLRGKARQLVVLLHGYGADGNDLISLAEHWQALLPEAAFIAPHAPTRCGMGGPGFEWFPLSRMDPHEMARGAEGAMPAIERFLEAELARRELSGDQLALVGFSQGTMMALQVGLRRRTPPAGIVGFSGIVVGAERLPDLTRGTPPVLLTHGEADQVIPAGALFVSAAALGTAGLPVQWHLAPGLGHGIDPVALSLAGGFLAQAFRGRLRPPVGGVACRYPR